MMERPLDCMDCKKIAKTEEDVEVYNKRDIETLRQKLNGDVDKMREDLFTGRNWKIVVKSIIKKRFGCDFVWEKN